MNENTFRQNIQKSGVSIRRKFVYDGTDYTGLLLKDGIGMIRRDINLSAGTVTVELDNSRNTWNFLWASDTALGDPAQVQVYISGDDSNVLTLFDGVVERVRFNEAAVVLTIRDSAGAWLTRKMGSNQIPTNYYSSTWNADDLVWDILTDSDKGNLDDTPNPLNTDIDYTSFAAWRDQHIRVKSYTLSARPTGHTIQTILMMICQHTHSFFYNNRDGKVAFAPPYQPGYTYDEGNTLGGRSLEIHRDNIINMTKIMYALNSLGEWVFFTPPAGLGNFQEDAVSMARFGEQPLLVENRVVYHIGSAGAGANNDRDDTLTEYAYPKKYFNLKVGPPGIMEDLCNLITVSDAKKQIVEATAKIEEISYSLNPGDFGVTLKARWDW